MNKIKIIFICFLFLINISINAKNVSLNKIYIIKPAKLELSYLQKEIGEKLYSKIPEEALDAKKKLINRYIKDSNKEAIFSFAGMCRGAKQNSLPIGQIELGALFAEANKKPILVIDMDSNSTGAVECQNDEELKKENDRVIGARFWNLEGFEVPVNTLKIFVDKFGIKFNKLTVAGHSAGNFAIQQYFEENKEDLKIKNVLKKFYWNALGSPVYKEKMEETAKEIGKFSEWHHPKDPNALYQYKSSVFATFLRWQKYSREAEKEATKNYHSPESKYYTSEVFRGETANIIIKNGLLL